MRMLFVTTIILSGVYFFINKKHNDYCKNLKTSQTEKRTVYLASQSRECEAANVDPFVCIQHLMLLQDRLSSFDSEVLKHERCD